MDKIKKYLMELREYCISKQKNSEFGCIAIEINQRKDGEKNDSRNQKKKRAVENFKQLCKLNAKS